MIYCGQKSRNGFIPLKHHSLLVTMGVIEEICPTCTSHTGDVSAWPPCQSSSLSHGERTSAWRPRWWCRAWGRLRSETERYCTVLWGADLDISNSFLVREKLLVFYHHSSSWDTRQQWYKDWPGSQSPGWCLSHWSAWAAGPNGAAQPSWIPRWASARTQPCQTSAVSSVARVITAQ